MKDQKIVMLHRGAKRLMSFDALRVFGMYWIIGGSSMINAISRWLGGEWMEIIGTQLEHTTWEGFRFFELIFPLFMFIAGIAIPLSVQSRLGTGMNKKKLVEKDKN